MPNSVWRQRLGASLGTVSKSDTRGETELPGGAGGWAWGCVDSPCECRRLWCRARLRRLMLIDFEGEADGRGAPADGENDGAAADLNHLPRLDPKATLYEPRRGL